MENKMETPPESHENPIPTWLKITYGFVVLWGILLLYFFWDGTIPSFDPGGWRNLQQAANTVWPYDQSQENN